MLQLVIVVEHNFGGFLHGLSRVLGPEGAVQLVLLALDVQVKVQHGGRDLLVRIPQHLHRTFILRVGLERRTERAMS